MRKSILLYLFAALPWCAPATAKIITVQMKTSGSAGLFVFEPALIRAAKGDTVRFLPTDPGHNAAMIEDIMPTGVIPTAGEIGKEFDIKLDKLGLYGIKCAPHFSMGMVALIKVGAGTSPNAATARNAKLPAQAAKRMIPLLKEAN